MRSELVFSLLDNIKNDTIELSNIVKFYQGIITGNNEEFLSESKIDSRYKKILRGKDINRYKTEFNNTYVLFDKKKLWSNTNEEYFLAEEKLINRQTSDKLIATYDNKKFYSLDSTHVQVLKNSDFQLKYLLALFNSSLINFYYNKIVNEGDRVFAQVKTVNLKILPIKKVSTETQLLFSLLTDYMLFLRNSDNPDVIGSIPNEHLSQFFESVINGCVYELYFEEHMKEKEIDVLQFVQADVVPIEGKSEAEKAGIIKQVYEKWREHKSPVRNRLLLFASRSEIISKIENGG